MKKKLLYGFPIILLVILLDRISKILVSSRMNIYESIRIFGNFFKITFVTNPYAAFSLKFGNYYIMMGLTIIAVIIIIFYFYKTPFTTCRNIALSMILGGAFGNLYDRIVHKEVIDFLDFGIGKWRYATFNIADSCVVIGVIILFILIFFENDKK